MIFTPYRRSSLRREWESGRVGEDECTRPDPLVPSPSHSPIPPFSHSRVQPRNRAFTLIELLVVITILVVLTAIIVPRVVGRGEDAKEAKAVADVESLGVALDLYAADNGVYPTSEQGLDALREPPSLPPTPRVWNGPYLKKRMPLDPWGRAYLYKSPGEGDPATYDLQSLGADGRPGGAGRDADIRSWE